LRVESYPSLGILVRVRPGFLFRAPHHQQRRYYFISRSAGAEITYLRT
jgi:hypothetical protein